MLFAGTGHGFFYSKDDGRTWSKGEKIDDIGGEPGYVLELSDGALAYTRTSSQKTDKLKNPPAPWNDIYYRNEIVFSRDGGKTWPEAHWLADSPFHGDCEVGLAELAKLLDRELHRAAALAVEAFADERNGAGLVDVIADGGEQALVCPPKDILVCALRACRKHVIRVPRRGFLNRGK